MFNDSDKKNKETLAIDIKQSNKSEYGLCFNQETFEPLYVSPVDLAEYFTCISLSDIMDVLINHPWGMFNLDRYVTQHLQSDEPTDVVYRFEIAKTRFTKLPISNIKAYKLDQFTLEQRKELLETAIKSSAQKESGQYDIQRYVDILEFNLCLDEVAKIIFNYPSTVYLLDQNVQNLITKESTYNDSERYFNFIKQRFAYSYIHINVEAYKLKQFTLEEREELLEIAVKNSKIENYTTSINLEHFDLSIDSMMKILIKYPWAIFNLDTLATKLQVDFNHDYRLKIAKKRFAISYIGIDIKAYKLEQFTLEQREELLEIAIKNSKIENSITNINLEHFDLPTDSMIGVLTKYPWAMFNLDVYASQLPVDVERDRRLEIAKKRFTYSYICIDIKAYKLEQFTLEQRKELLEIAAKNSNNDNCYGAINLGSFALSINDMLKILIKYPLSLHNVDPYVRDYMNTPELYHERKKIAFIVLNNYHFIQIDDYYLEEQDRIKILKYFAKFNPKVITNNIKRFKITEPKVRLEIFMLAVLHEPEIFFSCNDFDLSNTGVAQSLLETWGNIALKTEDSTELIPIGDLLKKQILDKREIWPNYRIWQRELEFLTEYDIKDEASALKFINMTIWLIYTATLADLLQMDPQKLLETKIQDTLKEIRTYSDPKIRFILSQIMIEEICNNQTKYDLYKQLNTKTKATLLPALILVHKYKLQQQEIIVPREHLNNILSMIAKQNRYYKDGKHLRPLVAGMHAIFETNKMDFSQKIILIKKILTCDFEQQKTCWWLIQAMLMPGVMNEEQWNNARQIMQDNIPQAFICVFGDVFKVNIHNINYYQTTFGKQHDQTALLIYYAKMKQLVEHERQPMLAILNKYVNSVLSSNAKEYYKLRYNEEFNPQLKLVFNRYPWLREIWQKGAKKNYDQFISKHQISNQIKNFDLIAFLKSKILTHQHLPIKYSKLFEQYMTTADLIEKQKIEDLLLKQQETISEQSATPQDKVQIKAAYDIQLALIKAVKENPTDPEKQITCLLEIKRNMRFVERCEFFYDVSTATRRLMFNSTKQTNTTGWSIIDTDHYWTMFMVGTEVEGSCQRVDGDPNLNKCLMGYVMNGDYRVLAIQNMEGITIARCMMHLLWDTNNQTATIFIEDLYPWFTSSQQQQVLYQFAIERAADLGLTLANVEGTIESASYNNPLIRESGGAPWVYCDADHGAKENGSYKIKQAQILYDPCLYALTHPAQLETNFYSAYQYLYQAWNNGFIRQITWQQTDEEKFIPIKIEWNSKESPKAIVTQFQNCWQNQQRLVSSSRSKIVFTLN